MKKKKTTVLLLCWTFLSNVWSDPLSPMPTAESLALASVLCRDGYTVFSPSLLTDESGEIRLSYTNHHLCNELQSLRLEGSLSTGRIHLGASFHTFGYTHYRTFSEALSYGMHLAQRTILGGSIHFTSLRYTGMIQHHNDLTIRLDILQSIKGKHNLYCQYAQRIPLSPHKDAVVVDVTNSRLLSGLELTVTTDTRFLLETECADWQRPTVKCAFEYVTHGLAIRLGTKGLPLTPSFGLGYRWNIWEIQIADQWLLHLGHQLGIDIHFQLHKLVRP